MDFNTQQGTSEFEGGLPMSSQPQMATGEQKNELLKMISEIKSKMGDTNSARFMGANVANEERMRHLKETFWNLQRAGVDLSDPQSVSQFIENMREKNPELASEFEEAINILIDGYSPSPVGQQEPPVLN